MSEGPIFRLGKLPKAPTTEHRDLGVSYPPSDLPIETQTALREKAAKAIEDIILRDYYKNDRLASVKIRLFFHRLADEIRGKQ